MFHINPTNSPDLARAVQNDYEREAAKYRMLKENGFRTGSMGIKAALTLTTVILAAATIVEFVF